MKHSAGVKRAVAWLPLAVMVFSAAAGCNKQARHAPDVWAVVNGKEIKREEVDKYYRTRVNPEGQEPSQEESLAQIVVTPRKEQQIRNRKNDDAANEAEAQRKVKMLMDRLNSGADFSQLAMDYSEDLNTAGTGGDLGYVPESALNQSDPALKKAVVALKAGQ